MPSLDLPTLLGAYNALDFKVPRDAGDAAPFINAAMRTIAGQERANGVLYFPPGTYNIRSSVVHLSNIYVVGFGPATIFQLDTNQIVDVWTANGITNFGLANLRIDGNRANNTAGTRNGLWLYAVTDAIIENVDAINARSDGFRLDACTRVEMRGCRAYDNGRHGFSLSYTEFCQLISPRAYNNCQVASAGVGDGINIELLSHDNAIICPMSYETALAGDKQGHGVREQAGEGCYRNVVLGGGLIGNRTANISMESEDSPNFTSASIRYDSAILTTV